MAYNILLVDDEEDIRFLFSSVLRKKAITLLKHLTLQNVLKY